VSVARSGTPAASTYTWSKILKFQIVEITASTAMIGRSSGSVTKRRRCQAVAPSTFAASSTSCGSVWRPASTAKAMNG